MRSQAGPGREHRVAGGFAWPAWMVLVGFLVSWLIPRPAAAATLPEFDFRAQLVARSWQAQHDLAPLVPSAEGLVATITGGDPYFAGPARTYPTETLLWLNLRLRSEAGGTCQVFYFRDGSGPTEPDSVRFAVPGGDWATVRVPVPAMGGAYRLRVDPPGETGQCTFERLWFEERLQFAAPAWLPTEDLALASDAPRIESGDIRLSHSASAWGGFVVDVAGRRMGSGQTRPLLGYALGGVARWWSFAGNGAGPTVAVREGGIEVALQAVDPDGATWKLRQTFRARPGRERGAISVVSSVEVDRERDLLHLPALLLFVNGGPGDLARSHKQQARLAGVEYLDDEPSSSEADLSGGQSRRQVVDTARLTFPLASVTRDGRYVGITWEMRPELAVFFDSPDRTFGSGGHAMGLIFPGSDGLNREEGSLVPYAPLRLVPGLPIEARLDLIGGVGSNSVSAVEHYVRLRGLPEIPGTGGSAESYFRLAAKGWLDTQIRQGDLFRHALGGSFALQPAADAAYQMRWLAERVGDPALSLRLRTNADGAIARVALSARYDTGVSHVRHPVAPLVFGGVSESATTALQAGRGQLSRFVAEGTVRYVRAAGGLDYARTHWTNEANGLTAEVVAKVLEAGVFSGDQALIDAGIRHLRALRKFAGTVPRGAQTWEVPLHTPDILAAAHLVRAHVLGYEITGDPGMLAAAREWAWSGLSFVFLRSPGPGPVGTYATTPVLGATQWIAPNWIGLPVQWCGLVYADALYRLAIWDGDGPWKRVADGIAASGVQQTYPVSDVRNAGLLPDSFSLKPQQRNPANINPGTLLACASRLFGGPPIHDFRSFRHHGVLVHAAGGIEVLREDKEGFALKVTSGSAGAHRVLFHGVFAVPVVRIDGREIALTAPHSHEAAAGRLLLEVSGTARIEVTPEARTAR